MKPTKDVTIRVRCEKGWKSDVESFARIQKLDMSDVFRLAVTGLMQQHSNYSNVLSMPRRNGK